jgi:hypothetical protein
MFVGHYAVAFAARAVKPAVPLGVLFVAVQVIDFAWAGFVLAGIEKVRITPGFLEASDLDLYHIPFSHSLVAGIVWAAAGGALYAALRRGGDALAAGAIVAAAVFSHWLLDLVVHARDLPLIYGEPKFGLGLWRSLVLSQALEIGLLVAGFVLYLRATRARGGVGHVAPWALLALLVALQAFSHVGPTPAGPGPFALNALLAFIVLALAAWGVDRARTLA